jgi:ferredoxin
MKVQVIDDLCIGCGACQAIAPEVFDMNDDGLAYVKNNDAVEKNEDAVTDAVESCPTSAIEKKED